MKTYLLTYRHEGADWVLELKAANAQDARARLGKLAYARLDGELIAKVPAALGLFARLSVWMKNLLATNN